MVVPDSISPIRTLSEAPIQESATRLPLTLINDSETAVDCFLSRPELPDGLDDLKAHMTPTIHSLASNNNKTIHSESEKTEEEANISIRTFK